MTRRRRADRPGRGQEGFGILETLTGLLVLILLTLMGTRAYRGAVANHKESAQVKALTDAVATTAERLSGLTLKALAGPGSPHLDWSEPAKIGKGPYHFRYRIVPNPSVGGAADTTVVGLEVESGTAEGGAFVATRTFATLIPPNISSRGGPGGTSNKAERDAEENFHRNLVARISYLTARVVPENEKRLDSYSCYDKGQCCGFMREYLNNPAIEPQDGVGEKCQYRCVLGGDVPIQDWKGACGIDFCTQSPWPGKPECCAAIAAGNCKDGSLCAKVCIECHGVDGSTCGPPPCEEWFWPDFFDCASGTFCDGTPLPDGEVPGWGNVKAWCKQPECKKIQATCPQRVGDCCENYWRPLKAGQPVGGPFEICAKISRPEECCGWEAKMGYWTFNCGTDGRVKSARIDANGQWFCTPPTEAWHDNCAMMKGCGSTVVPAGAPAGGCQAWTGSRLESPWVDPLTGYVPGGVSVGSSGGGGPGKISTGEGGGGRKGSKRDGDGGERRGGRE